MFVDKPTVYNLWPSVILERQSIDTSWHEDWTPISGNDGHLDLFAPSEGNRKILNMINQGVNEWLVASGATHFIGRERMIVRGSCNWYTGAEYVPTHWHGSDLVCVYYLHSEIGESIPVDNFVKNSVGVDFKSGSIVFFDPRGASNRMGDAGEAHTPWKEFRPVKGTLLVFPGYLAHNTTPHNTDGTKRAVVTANIRFA